ncbi:MAG: response regulator transcription factor [Proteobacteria bacterium]|nr:response regulator transcription factor [Pseudomonadota bacterium]
MTLRVLLVDDEALARARLRTLLAECREPPALVTGEAANAADAMSLLARQRFDVALLDIHLPGADGMQLAAALRDVPAPPAVVFVTAYTDYAVQAFDIAAADYLTKPVRLERLQTALQKVQRLAPQGQAPEPDFDQQWLLISERGRTLRVPVTDVLYLRAELKYVTVRTAAASHVLDGSLSQLEERFAERFVRIHRNALVARHAMRALVRHVDVEEGEGWAVQLAGADEVLAVSRRQLAAVRAALGP